MEGGEKLPLIDKSVVEEAKQMDLLTYLRAFEPDELVYLGGNTYTTRTHDSLKISNGKWMWWSRGIGGRSALDYLIKVKEVPFPEAVSILSGKEIIIPMHLENSGKNKQKALLLPEKSASAEQIKEYLFSRGIDLEIINDCIDKELIYESLPYHNVIFVGKDRNNVPRYAAFRATDKSRIMGDATGSDKHYSFHTEGKEGNPLHLFESAIDALSYAIEGNAGDECRTRSYPIGYYEILGYGIPAY